MLPSQFAPKFAPTTGKSSTSKTNRGKIVGKVETARKSTKIESVATLLGIADDTVSVFRYFTGPNSRKEDGHDGTGRIRGG